jgi:hypothetical protein
MDNGLAGRQIAQFGREKADLPSQETGKRTRTRADKSPEIIGQTDSASASAKGPRRRV